MKKKIVILGATGTVGSKISENLLKEGHQVAVIARHGERLEKFRSMGAEIIASDVNDVETLTNAFKNAGSAFRCKGRKYKGLPTTSNKQLY